MTREVPRRRLWILLAVGLLFLSLLFSLLPFWFPRSSWTLILVFISVQLIFVGELMTWAWLRRLRLLMIPLGLLLVSGVLALVAHGAGRMPHHPVAIGLGIAQNSTRLLGWGLLFIFLIGELGGDLSGLSSGSRQTVRRPLGEVSE